MCARTIRASAREGDGRGKEVVAVIAAMVAVRRRQLVQRAAYACGNGLEQEEHQQTAAIGCPHVSSNKRGRSCPADVNAACPCSGSSACRSARRPAVRLYLCVDRRQSAPRGHLHSRMQQTQEHRMVRVSEVSRGVQTLCCLAD
jgi:hypothetical protein